MFGKLNYEFSEVEKHFYIKNLDRLEDSAEAEKFSHKHQKVALWIISSYVMSLILTWILEKIKMRLLNTDTKYKCIKKILQE